MKSNELRKLSTEDLSKKCVQYAQELFTLKFQLHTGRLENTSKLRNLRKDIARINTILTENRVKGVSK